MLLGFLKYSLGIENLLGFLKYSLGIIKPLGFLKYSRRVRLGFLKYSHIVKPFRIPKFMKYSR